MSSRIKLAAGVGIIAALSSLSYAVAFALRFGGWVPGEYVGQLALTLPIVMLAKIVALYVCRVHAGFNRYVSFEDLVNLAKATTISSLIVTLLDAFLFPGSAIPRGVLLIDWGVTLLVIGGARSVPRAVRGLRNRYCRPSHGVRAVIVGANAHGESLLRALRTASDQPYQVIGFLDETDKRRGQRIGEAPILGSLTDAEHLFAKHQIDVALIVGGLPGVQVRRLMEQTAAASVDVRVLPTYDQLLRQDVAVSPRPVAIDDLLRRDPVDLDVENAREWLGGRTVLVTGSAGSIGSEVCRQILRLAPARLVAVDRSETGQFFLERELRQLAPEVEIQVTLADLTDADRLREIFRLHEPDVVFHAAAYKHVPLMEQHPGEAIKNIVLATQNIADTADESGAAAFVMVSTDKAVNPTSVMGSCKRIAERYVQAKAETSACQFSTVRFGNVLDSAGSVAPIFREQIARGGPVTVTHPDMTRYFMMIPEAAQLVIQAGMQGQGGEIFVLDMGDPVHITDLARDMIRLSGLREGDDIEIVYTGLRPGEKLYEELYSDHESHIRTTHPKIMVAACQPENLLALSHLIGNLRDASNGPADAIRGLIVSALPEARFASPATQAAA